MDWLALCSTWVTVGSMMMGFSSTMASSPAGLSGCVSSCSCLMVVAAGSGLTWANEDLRSGLMLAGMMDSRGGNSSSSSSLSRVWMGGVMAFLDGLAGLVALRRRLGGDGVAGGVRVRLGDLDRALLFVSRG